MLRAGAHGGSSLFPLILFALSSASSCFGSKWRRHRPPGSIYFSSGTKEPVVVIESTLLLPVIFLAVVALFVAVAERMGREMAAQPPLAGYMANIVGSLAGVAAFAVLSWLQLPPSVWFGVAGLAALPLLATAEPGGRLPARSAFLVSGALLAGVMSLTHLIAAGSLWSPDDKISVSQQGPDTVIEVNNIFHQSMAPIAQKEYFYQWRTRCSATASRTCSSSGPAPGVTSPPHWRTGRNTWMRSRSFRRSFSSVARSIRIIRITTRASPSSTTTRVTICGARTRGTIVVFALIDSLTLQSGFSGVRLESYMFTQESFRAVRDRLTPDGLLVIYNSSARSGWLTGWRIRPPSPSATSRGSTSTRRAPISE